MASTPSKVANKLGEKVQHGGDHTSSSLQRRTTTKQYAVEALKQAGLNSFTSLVEYESVVKMVEYLRHRNPDCGKTIVTYLSILNTTLKALKNTTPDNLVRAAKEADEDQLEALFLDLDDHWLEELNATATRMSKWAMLKTFLEANHVRKARLVKCNIRSRKKTIDAALTREDCCRILEQAQSTTDKLIVALLIESLQRIGTITLLTWGDMRPHLEKGEDIFLIWIDPQRTKRNIEHWAPIGPLSTFFMRKLLVEFREKGAEVRDEDTLITSDKRYSAKTGTIIQRLHRIMVRAGVVGKKQGEGRMTRYEKHVHSFRKFGKVEMQRNKVNEDVINYLMGHRRDTYSEWRDRYDDLLEIYRENRPQIDQKTPQLSQEEALNDIVQYAWVRGYSLDPKQLRPNAEISALGDIRADPNPHPNSGEGAEATRVFKGSRRSLLKCFS